MNEESNNVTKEVVEEVMTEVAKKNLSLGKKIAIGVGTVLLGGVVFITVKTVKKIKAKKKSNAAEEPKNTDEEPLDGVDPIQDIPD